MLQTAAPQRTRAQVPARAEELRLASEDAMILEAAQDPAAPDVVKAAAAQIAVAEPLVDVAAVGDQA